MQCALPPSGFEQANYTLGSADRRWERTTIGADPVRGGSLGLSVKLPSSGEEALDLPFARPTGYGLGKSGWVTARFEPGDRPPFELLKDWITESYRAIAPKKLRLEAERTRGAPRRR